MVKSCKWWKLPKSCLNFHSLYMPQTVPNGTVFFRHNPDKIISNIIRMNTEFFSVKWWCSKECPSFWSRECLQRMCMRVIASISYFDKYRPLSILGDNIDFSTLELKIPSKNRISRLDEIPTSNIFSLIADTPARNLSFLLYHSNNSSHCSIVSLHLQWPRIAYNSI